MIKSGRRGICALLLSAVLASCASWPEDAEEKNMNITLTFPENGAENVMTANELVAVFTGEKYAFGTDDPYSAFAGLPSGGAQTKPVTFRWENQEGTSADILHLALNPGFDGEWTFPTAGNHLEIDSLMSGTTYFWKVTGAGGGTSDVFSFTTADVPRIVRIDGVSNCRDLGGWRTEGGDRVRQGMVYRTATLDNITEEGVKFCREFLRIKTELDLRNEGEGTAGSTLLGEGVNYIRISPPYYVDDGHGLYDKGYTEGMRQIFSVFADPDNYPILFHCSAGVDRTGTVAFLLSALCGMSREDIFHEHDLSLIQFLPAGHKDTLTDHYSRLFNPMYQSLADRGGGTLKVNTEQYCRDIGVSDAEIQAIQRTLIAEMPGGEVEDPGSQSPGTSGKARINIPVVIAAAAGGIIIILCAGYFAFRKKKSE